MSILRLALLPLLLSSPARPANQNRDPLPPAALLHIGQKKHLLEDHRLGTIPEEVWNTYIMGRQTNFGLVPYRRGLYGGANFDTLELYANSYLGSRSGTPKTPWVMRIRIREECRRPDAVSDLATDEKFLGWLWRETPRLVKNASFCLNPAASDCGSLIVGTQPIANGREENACDDVMQQFMNDMKPRVVRDTEWDSSWYLRDRACIENLHASPIEVLGILAHANWDWLSRKSTYSGSNGYGTGSIAMLLSALADLPDAPETMLLAIRKKLESSDIRLSFTGESPAWVRNTGPQLVDAFFRCRRSGSHEMFREAALAQELEWHDARNLSPGSLPQSLERLERRFSSLCPR